MVGIIQRISGLDLSGNNLPTLAVPSLFERVPNVDASYNFLNNKDSSGNNNSLITNGAFFDVSNRYMTLTSSQYAQAPVNLHGSFCAVITFKTTDISSSRHLFGDYKENTQANTNGIVLGVKDSPQSEVFLRYKGQDGINGTLSHLTDGTVFLNNWKTIILNVNRGTIIRLYDETGSYSQTTDVNAVNFTVGVDENSNPSPVRFGMQVQQASIGISYFVGQFASGAIINGYQDEATIQKLLRLSEETLTQFERGYAYG